MLAEYDDLYRTASELHEQLFTRLTALDTTMTAIVGLKEKADAIHSLNEVEKLVDAINKRVKVMRKKLDGITGLEWSLGDDGEPIRTAYCTCSPKTKQTASFPRRDDEPEAYYAATDHFGIPRELAETEMFRPHWPTLSALLTDLGADGLALPPGLERAGKTYTEFKVACRRKANAPW